MNLLSKQVNLSGLMRQSNKKSNLRGQQRGWVAVEEAVAPLTTSEKGSVPLIQKHMVKVTHLEP